ncbi:HlyD family secretion protein [Winslowiella toletana]|uniref:HlyD family secretion protein n=1 Tax=Winslowiella toletana TaxID=92490 RepID=UPI0004768953|nr:HlyD family secretion protein [Winslowiella toletana]
MYRKEAIEHRKNIWSGKALLLSGVPVSYMTIFTVIFFTCFLCLLIFGSYTRRINVSGEIVSSPRAINVLSAQQGFVVRQMVSAGENVEKGQPIYQIDVSRTTSSGVVSKRISESIQQQISTLNEIAKKIRENKKITLDTLNRQKSHYENALQHSSAILTKAEEGLRIMKANMDNYHNYQVQGLINKDQLANQTALYYQQQNELLNLHSQNQQNALQIVSLQSNIQTQAVDFDNQLHQLEIQKSSLRGQLTTADAESELIITAPVAGRVDSLSVTTGQMVAVGDSLLQIIPGDTTRYSLILWVPDTAAPYLATGDGINIRYDAFPAEKFGQYSGQIIAVGRTPASLQEMATYPSAPARSADNPQTWYKVVVSPDKDRFYYKDHWVDAENGMKATSTLFLEERKLYQWVLSPLYDLRNSAGGLASGK